MFKLFDKKLIVIKLLLFLCVILIAWNSYLTYENDRLITKLNRNIEIFKFGYGNKLIDIVDFLTLLSETTKNNDKNILQIINNINNNINKVKDKQNQLKRDFLLTKKLDVENIENILEANLLLRNKTKGYQGSGTHIKINSKSYILTCWHLIVKENDKFVAINDIGDEYPMFYIKSNKKIDLALFEIKNVNHLSYLEISKENPKIGSEVLVVGNPSCWNDVVTDGIIAQKEKVEYCLTNLSYFGSSGGAVLYKGKIVGVISKLYTDFKWKKSKNIAPSFVAYTIAVNVETIREFLKGVK